MNRERIDSEIPAEVEEGELEEVPDGPPEPPSHTAVAVSVVTVTSGDDEGRDVEDPRSAREASSAKEEAPAKDAQVVRAPPPAKAVAAPAASTGSWKTPALVALIAATNIGVVLGHWQSRKEERKVLAPLSGVAAEVSELKSAQGDLGGEIHEARTELGSLRGRLARQEKLLEDTREQVAKNEERDVAFEQATKDRYARDVRAVADLSTRLRKLEKSAGEGTMTLPLGEAMKLIDEVQVEPAPKAAPAPKVATPPKAEHGHDEPAPHGEHGGGHDAHGAH